MRDIKMHIWAKLFAQMSDSPWPLTCNVLVTDNTASIVTKRGGFSRREQTLYQLPILIMDSGNPSLSSTNMLSIHVCHCDPDGVAQSCTAEAFMLSAGLSTGALVAILACVLTLLGKIQPRRAAALLTGSFVLNNPSFLFTVFKLNYTRLVDLLCK